MHKRVVVRVVGLVTLSLVVSGALGLFAWRTLQRVDYERAIASMPASTLRATYTDWSQVRSMAGGTSLGAGSSASEIEAFLRRAYDQDLTSTSSVVDATYAMEELYGFSSLEASWEMFGQSREGAVAAMAMPDSVSFDEIEANLETLGYQPPTQDTGSGGGVWAGSADLLAGIDPALTPVLENLVVLPDEQLILMSDDTGYASSSADVIRSESPSLEETDGVDDLADAAAQPVSSVLFASDFACETLSMATADEEDQRAADQLVGQAGEVAPLAGLVMALDPSHSMTVGMWFETSDQAAEDLAPRVELASGEAVGQGGTFPDRFEVASGESSGQTVVLDLQPVGSKADVTESTLLSDLSQGPVLFARC